MSALKTNYISHVSSQNIATILNNSKYYLIAGFAGYLAKSLIDEHYSCQMPIETIIYDENMELYQVGELMTIWELPQIHRDVRRYLE